MCITSLLSPILPISLISQLAFINYPKNFCFIWLSLSVSGYLSEVLSIKVSKEKERKYFIFSIQNDETLHPGVFPPEEHRLFFGNIMLILVLKLTDSTLVATTMLSMLITLHLLKKQKFKEKFLKKNFASKHFYNRTSNYLMCHIWYKWSDGLHL